MPPSDVLTRRQQAIGRYLQELEASDAHPRSASLEREEHRPFSSLAWYAIGGADRPQRVIVKSTRMAPGARPAARPREAALARKLHDAFGGRPSRVVLPLRDYEDLNTTITGVVPGQSLADLIDATGRHRPSSDALGRLRRACAHAGAWLRALHDADAERCVWQFDELREDLDNRLRRLVGDGAVAGMHAVDRDRVLAWLDGIGAATGYAPLSGSLTHGDFSPSNMLVDDEKVHVLDFTMVRPAPHLLDVTRFCHQLDLLALKPLSFRRSTRVALQRAFLDGYDRQELLESPLATVFMVRHALTHWVSRARQVRRGRRRRIGPALVVCLHNRRRVRQLVAGAPLPWESR